MGSCSANYGQMDIFMEAEAGLVNLIQSRGKIVVSTACSDRSMTEKLQESKSKQ